jgi:hypothetical protein
MNSLKEQIKGKCKHFNGIMNECCNVGVNYADVRVGKPYQFPCIKEGGECSKIEFLTDEEVQQEIDEINSMGIKTVIAYAKIKEHFNSTKVSAGKIDCECGGELNYNVAQVNGHIWANCKSCQLSF